MNTMQRIGLIDVDGHNFPNLALMKIAGYYRERAEVAAEVSDSRKKEIEELAIKFFSK